MPSTEELEVAARDAGAVEIAVGVEAGAGRSFDEDAVHADGDSGGDPEEGSAAERDGGVDGDGREEPRVAEERRDRERGEPHDHRDREPREAGDGGARFPRDGDGVERDLVGADLDPRLLRRVDRGREEGADDGAGAGELQGGRGERDREDPRQEVAHLESLRVVVEKEDGHRAPERRERAQDQSLPPRMSAGPRPEALDRVPRAGADARARHDADDEAEGDEERGPRGEGVDGG